MFEGGAGEMNRDELNKILENHLHWLNEDVEGWEDMRADLSNADLSNAGLVCANLRGANLSDANLRGANLVCADLVCANLSDANLSNANLSGANLSGTDLRGAKGALIEFRKGKMLTEDVIGYKKCRDDVIVKLLIPRGAIVFSINGNKCRTNKAKVLEIEGATRAISQHKYMSYYVGDEFTVYDFNCEYNVECAPGIHFFMTKEEAVNYN